MPPKKIKKRIEEYNSCLSDIFFLDQVLDLIESAASYLRRQPDNPLGQAQKNCIDTLKDTIQAMKSTSTISVIPTIDSNIINYIAAFEDEVSSILADVYKYLLAHVNIHNGLVQTSISRPSIDHADLGFFYSYIIYENSIIKNFYSREDFEEILRVAGADKKIGIKMLDQSATETYYHPLVDIIIGLLADPNTSPSFYIDDEMLEQILRILDDYEEREYLRTIDSSISHARNSFIENQSYKHPIYELVSLIQTGLSSIPSFLTDSIATSPIVDWPLIELVVSGYLPKALSINVSINDLIKFQAHLIGFNHLRLFIKIPKLTDAENEKFLSSLIKHLSHIDEDGKELHLLGSGGSLRLPVLFSHKPHDINKKEKTPNALIKHIAEFIKKYCEENHKEVVIDLDQLSVSLSSYFKKFSQQYGLMSYGLDGKTGLALFESTKLLKLLYQTLSCKPDAKDLPQEITPCLWQEQVDEILGVLGYTLKVALRVKNISSQSDFDNVLWNISKIINKKIIEGESVILQLGIPKISSNADSSGHAFYVILQSSNSKAKIIIVDGEDRENIDPQYDVIDKGKGVRILCRETIEFSLEPQNKIFLRNYIYKALKLKYESCSNIQEVEKLLDNIKLKNSEFIGRNSLLTSIPDIESGDNSHSMASQNFEDCTMCNLRESFRILFNWNAAKMAHFMSDAICRFNFLLYQNDQHINQFTKQSQKLLKDKEIEMHKNAAGLFLQEHYSGLGHEIGVSPLDGNCFYHSINFLLHGRLPQPRNHIDLRNDVVTYLRNHPEMITNNGIDDVDGYLSRISNHGDVNSDGEWADSIQVSAMLEVLREHGINNIVLHTAGNQLQIADYQNLDLSNALHIYYHNNHYMPIIENPNNRIEIAIDRTALEHEAMVDYRRVIISLRNDSSSEEYSTDFSSSDGSLNDEVSDSSSFDGGDDDSSSQHSISHSDDKITTKKEKMSSAEIAEDDAILGLILNNLYAWIKILPEWIGNQIINSNPIKEFIEESKKRAEIYQGSKSILVKLSNLFYIEPKPNTDHHQEERAKVSLHNDYEHLVDTSNIIDNPTKDWVLPIIAVGCVSIFADPAFKLYMNDFDLTTY